MTGSEAYKARCVRLPIRYGFTITNPELQADMRKEKVLLGDQRGLGAVQIGRPANVARSDLAGYGRSR